ncbi:programmed cell death protein 7 [Cottoperca gobio]|uniref:Programmed cell death protein 7 n=1 Tax=Cottoperca gobio TaxID=56716 RepID=A0A6J2S998_COTGO|nr:programmed cell death protein 7-like [Cottoperca gobio]
MENIYHHASSETQQHLAYNGGYLETPYTANNVNMPLPGSAAHEPTQPDHNASPWTSARGYDGHAYGFMCDFPAPPPGGGGGFGGPRMPFPYGFDPSVPPPPFGCPPPGHFPNVVNTAPINTYSSRGASTVQTFTVTQRFGPQTTRYDLDSSQKQQHEYEGFSERAALYPPQGKDHDRSPRTATRPEDETALQRRQDQQWLGRFLKGREKSPQSPQTPRQPPPHSCAPAPGLREALYSAARLVSQLTRSCETLRNNVENECVWADSYVMALNVKRELQDSLRVLGDSERLGSWKAKLSRVSKRRARRLRARTLLQVEDKEREDLITEKEAAINTWRLQQIRQVEEKKKERELKLAADSVLCEVRKKQADVKRMQDILRSLEKLRRLRKEAASRKGIVTERECDEAFGSRLEQLRCVMKKRTGVYSAEEKALMVMLEGEQEEERRREQEKHVKKERERQLQRKHRVDAMLFGDKLPADCVLEPFREYYTQAERSLHALLQIRREWDTFVVLADHPDSSPVPHSWILPDAPSDQAWASALHIADTE